MITRKDEDYDHVLKFTGLFGGVQGVIIVITLVRNKAMALLLGTSGMGFNALLISAQNFAAQCTNLGISLGAVPRLSELFEKECQEQLQYYIKVIRLWSFIAALLGLLFCVAVSPLINNLSFTWGNHTLHYAMLGLSVSMMAITGGEVAVLKSTRRLGALALTQIYTAIASVLLSIPLFYIWHHSGVVPSIVLVSLVSLLVTAWFSYRHYPLRLHFDKGMLSEGFGMIRLGVAFVLAAAIGSGTEMLVRSYLNVEGGMDNVGLYNAAYMITITYAGMVFSAMETDFFPRLSAVNHDIAATNEMVNRQMEVSLLILSPMLVGLLMLLPALVPLLFTNEFLPVVSMAQVAVMAMYFKVLTLPVAYITLARGCSLAYLVLESLYFVVFVVSVAIGYKFWGIYGTGVAIVVAHVFDFLLINGYAYWRYKYRSSLEIGQYAAIQMLIGLVAFIVSLSFETWLYWVIEAILVMFSAAYSIYVLRHKTRLWESLMCKLGLRRK